VSNNEENRDKTENRDSHRAGCDKGKKDIEDLTLQDLGGMLWRQRLIIIIITLAAAAAGGLYGAAFTPAETVYTNEAIVDQDVYDVNYFYLKESLDEYEIEQIAEGFDTGSSLEASFNLEVDRDAEIMRLEARGEDEQELNSFLREVGLSIVANAREIRLRALEFDISNKKRAVDRLDEQIMQHLGELPGEDNDITPRDYYRMLEGDGDKLLDSLFEGRAEIMAELTEKEATRDYIKEGNQVVTEEDMVVLKTASSSTHHAMGTPRTNVVLAGIIGLVFACLVALVRERLVQNPDRK